MAEQAIEVIRREAVYLWYYFTLQLWQILPYWLLGMLIGSLVLVFLKDRIHSLVRRLSGSHLGVAGIAAASSRFAQA